MSIKVRQRALLSIYRIWRHRGPLSTLVFPAAESRSALTALAGAGPTGMFAPMAGAPLHVQHRGKGTLPQWSAAHGPWICGGCHSAALLVLSSAMAREIFWANQACENDKRAAAHAPLQKRTPESG